MQINDELCRKSNTTWYHKIGQSVDGKTCRFLGSGHTTSPCAHSPAPHMCISRVSALKTPATPKTWNYKRFQRRYTCKAQVNTSTKTSRGRSLIALKCVQCSRQWNVPFLLLDRGLVHTIHWTLLKTMSDLQRLSITKAGSTWCFLHV